MNPPVASKRNWLLPSLALIASLAVMGCGSGSTCERVDTFGDTINAYPDRGSWTLSKGSVDPDFFEAASPLVGARIIDLKKSGSSVYGTFFMSLPVTRDGDGCKYFLLVHVDPAGIRQALSGIDVRDLDGSELGSLQKIELEARLQYEQRGQENPESCLVELVPEDAGHSAKAEIAILVFQEQGQTGQRYYAAESYSAIEDFFMELSGSFRFLDTEVGEVSTSFNVKLAARQSLLESEGSADCAFGKVTERVAEDW